MPVLSLSCRETVTDNRSESEPGKGETTADQQVLSPSPAKEVTLTDQPKF